MTQHDDGPDTLRVPFLFVKHGDPPPLEWMARHPGWVKFPAVMIPRDSPDHPMNGGRYPTFPRMQPPPQPPVDHMAQAAKWPFGVPVSLGVTGCMSRLEPGDPPQYPGGYGPRSVTSLDQNPVAAYLRANEVFKRLIGTSEPRVIDPDGPATASTRSYLPSAAASETIPQPIASRVPSGIAQDGGRPTATQRGQFQQAQGWFFPLLEEPPAIIRPPIEEFPTDPAQPPGPGFEWKGRPGSTPGGRDGNWFNPCTGESLRPDLRHEDPVGPHYDDRAPDGSWYRWFKDGRIELKGKGV